MSIQSHATISGETQLTVVPPLEAVIVCRERSLSAATCNAVVEKSRTGGRSGFRGIACFQIAC